MVGVFQSSFIRLSLKKKLGVVFQSVNLALAASLALCIYHLWEIEDYQGDGLWPKDTSQVWGTDSSPVVDLYTPRYSTAHTRNGL